MSGFILSASSVSKFKQLLHDANSSNISRDGSDNYHSQNHIAFVKCGSIADSSNKVYSGNVVIFRDDLSNDATYADVYLCDANGGELVENTIYLSIGTTEYTYSDLSHQLYVTQKGEKSGDIIRIVRPTSFIDLEDDGSGHAWYLWSGNVVNIGGGTAGEVVTDTSCWIMQRTTIGDEISELLVVDNIYTAHLVDGGSYFAYDESHVDYRQLYAVLGGSGSDLGEFTCLEVLTDITCDDNTLVKTTQVIKVPTDWLFDDDTGCAESVGEGDD